MAISLAQLTRANAPKPPRILIHGVAGVGKTTFASEANKPVFVQTEDGLGTLASAHFPLARTYEEVIEALAALYTEPHDFKTVVIDSVDWLEPLVWAKACRDNGWASIEDAGYGKGYVAALTSLAPVHRRTERPARRPWHDGGADRPHRHQALRQPRARPLRPLRDQAAHPRRRAAARALRRRAVRQLPDLAPSRPTSGSTRR